ncbi:MAG: hypothetical protein ACM3S1_15190 [Hyphomicrobiales bacterium]
MSFLSIPGVARRLVLALAMVSLVPAAAFLQPADPAEARFVWCAADPTIIVNGSPVSVTVHLPFDRLRDVDYVEVRFHVPSNANVQAVVNDSLLFKAQTVIVKDQRPSWGLFGTPVPVEIIVHHSGPDFDIAATGIVLGWGSSLWTQGTTAQPLTLTTYGLLNLRLL